MKRRRRWPLPRTRREAVIWGVSSAFVGVTVISGYLVGAGTFSESRAALVGNETVFRTHLLKVREERKERPELDQRIQRYVDRTLGADLASADSALRGRLNRIGEELRVESLRVTTGTSTARQSPAKGQFNRSVNERKFREEVDFVELQASLSGEGTLEQVLRLLHRIEVEPWMKRVDSVRLEELKGGERMKVVVRLSTLFLPGRKGGGELKPSQADLDRFDQYAALVATNPFRLPQAAPPPMAATQLAPPPPPPVTASAFPYEQWLLTGLVSGPTGIEAWLRNGTTGESRQLAPGGQLGDAVFVGGEGDLAEFTVGEQRFRIQVGGDLARR